MRGLLRTPFLVQSAAALTTLAQGFKTDDTIPLGRDLAISIGLQDTV
jgi:hypothetical protein